VGVAGVQFKLNGANLGAELTGPPYSMSWTTGTVANGPYTLTAVARDAAGNRTTSGGVAVTVANTIVITDATPPTVAITSPAANATVSSTTTLTATAGDNVGVAGVQFKLNGANLGGELTSPPYSMSWNTAAATNGGYTLTAVARDAAGNRTTSAAVAVNVSNGSSGGGGGGGGGTGGAGQAVTWANLVNVTASGNSLQKTGGCDGCTDAGAVSVQMIGLKGGHVEFTASETNTLRYIGLARNVTGTGTAMRFTIRLQDGIAEVRESGSYRTDTTFAPGDVFRIAVESGKVNYYKNGQLFFRSGVNPVYPLLVDTALLNSWSTIQNVRLYRAP